MAFIGDVSTIINANFAQILTLPIRIRTVMMRLAKAADADAAVVEIIVVDVET